MTVAELKERMSADELQDWIAYIDINGPLHAVVRIEHAIARAVSPFVKSGHYKSFAPWPKEQEKEASLDDFMSILRSAKKSPVVPPAADSPVERKQKPAKKRKRGH